MAASAVLDGVLFVMGGRDDKIKHNSVECYFPNLNNWISLAPMTEVRVAAQACVAFKFLYVFGGSGEKMSSTIEKYDPKTDTWTLVIHKLNINYTISWKTKFRNPLKIILRIALDIQ